MGIDDNGSVGNAAARRGRAAWIRIYLGYAPGVGKTHAMLDEGRAQKERGLDVIIGWVQTYDRPRTLEAVGPLEILAPRRLVYRGIAFEEMDVDAILARRPQLVLVDELAHTNVAGSKHAARFQDVLELQASGISVISTVNVQQLASLQDTIRVVTGVNVRETLPDWVLDAADELEMVDEPPEALQRRVRRGNVLPREQIDRALEGYFRIDTLTALRELALRRVGEHSRRVDEPPTSEGHAPSSETVLVCLPPSRQAQAVLITGLHLANSLQARLLVLHVTQPSRSVQPEESGGYQDAVRSLQLARAFGAEIHTRGATNIAETLVKFATEVRATHVVLGESSHSRLHELLRGSVLRSVLRQIRDMDVHLVRLTRP